MLHFYNMWFYRPLRKQSRLLAGEKNQLTNELPAFESQNEELKRLEEVYKQRFGQFSELEGEVSRMESDLPSKQSMAELLEQLTSALEGTKTEFISIEPTVNKAEETEPFDSMDVDVQFYGNFNQVMDYLKAVETKNTLIGIKTIHMELNQDESQKTKAGIRFSTFLGSRTSKKEKLPEIPPLPVVEPFHPESKPFDNRMPGDHRLTMIIWSGGKPVALIDGKVMKMGATLDNKKLVRIDSDGVWFSENNIEYYLTLEK